MAKEVEEEKRGREERAGRGGVVGRRWVRGEMEEKEEEEGDFGMGL